MRKDCSSISRRRQVGRPFNRRWNFLSRPSICKHANSPVLNPTLSASSVNLRFHEYQIEDFLVKEGCNSVLFRREVVIQRTCRGKWLFRAGFWVITHPVKIDSLRFDKEPPNHPWNNAFPPAERRVLLLKEGEKKGTEGCNPLSHRRQVAIMCNRN